MKLVSCVWCVFAIFALLAVELSGKRPPKATKGKIKDRERDEEVVDINVEDASLSLEIQHAIGSGNEFVTRGKIFLKSLRSSASVNFQQESLSPSQLSLLKDAARRNDIYAVRTRSKFNQGSNVEDLEGGTYVSTFISACALVNARLSDEITISGDGQGNVIGLMLTPSLHSTYSLCEDITGPLPHTFNTSVAIDNGTPPPVPDTQSFLRKVEEQEKEKREGKDNRSFLQKYWLYIVVGFAAFMMLGGGPGGGGGGGGSGGQ